MANELDPRLIEAIDRNSKWILKRCRFSEFIQARCEELYQDTMIELIKSNERFKKNKVNSPDAWVKRVVSNTVSTYTQKEAKRVKEEIVDNFENVHCNENLSVPLETQDAFSYIKKNFSLRDQEIMHLHYMGEPHKEIAEIEGIKQASVTNTVSKLNGQISNYLNRVRSPHEYVQVNVSFLAHPLSHS